MSSLIAPAGAGDRFTEIDALRGFALFGILLANLPAPVSISTTLSPPKPTRKLLPNIFCGGAGASHSAVRVLIIGFVSGSSSGRPKASEEQESVAKTAAIASCVVDIHNLLRWQDYGWGDVRTKHHFSTEP